ARGAYAARAENILVRNRYAIEDAGVAVGACLVGGVSLRQRLLGGDGNETVQRAIERVDAIEKMLRQFARGKVALLQAVAQLRECFVVQAHSITFGTR